jgi:hypothetical protein
MSKREEQTMTKQSKSWRDVIEVHSAADLFPMMTADELKALGEDIKKNGLTSPIVLWSVLKANRPQYSLLDGRNRLDAMEATGLSLIDDNGELNIKCDIVAAYRLEGLGFVPSGIDPYDYVLSANLHRRHLTAEQKREIVAKVLKAQPSKSNRTIAKQTKVDDKTVAAVRGKLEATAEIPQLAKTVGKDGKARTTTPKKRGDIEGDIAEKKAKADTDAPRLAPQQVAVREGKPPLATEVNAMVGELDKFVTDYVDRLHVWMNEHYADLDPDGRFCLRQFAEVNSFKLNTLAQALLQLETDAKAGGASGRDCQRLTSPVEAMGAECAEARTITR